MNEQQHYRQAKDVFLKVCDAPRSQRSTMLSRLCGNDAELRRDVESLLEHYDSTAETAAPGDPRDGTPTGHEDDPIDPETCIGPYRIVRRLGHGGGISPRSRAASARAAGRRHRDRHSAP